MKWKIEKIELERDGNLFLIGKSKTLYCNEPLLLGNFSEGIFYPSQKLKEKFFLKEILDKKFERLETE